MTTILSGHGIEFGIFRVGILFISFFSELFAFATIFSAMYYVFFFFGLVDVGGAVRMP